MCPHKSLDANCPSKTFCPSGLSRHRTTPEMSTPLRGTHTPSSRLPSRTNTIRFLAPVVFHASRLLANPRPHPRIYDVCTHIIAKKYFLPKGGGTKLNKQISRVRRCKPWLQNKAVPSEQLGLMMQLNPHGSWFFLLVLRVATRRRRGGLSVAFSEKDLGGSWAAWALLLSSGIERPREVVHPSHGSCHSPCPVS